MGSPALRLSLNSFAGEWTMCYGRKERQSFCDSCQRAA
jgi:hypothetical protein